MFGLQKFEYDVIRYRGFCCSSSYSTCLASSEMVGYVGYVWKVQYFFKCFFYSYLSFFTLYSHYTYATSFEVGPHFLDVLLQFFAVIPFSFFKFFFFLAFQFGKVIDPASTLLILSLAMYSLLINLSKALFIYVTVFLTSHFFFRFFPSVSITLLTLLICSC